MSQKEATNKGTVCLILQFKIFDVNVFSFENYICTNSFEKQNDIKKHCLLRCEYSVWLTMQSLFSLAEIIFVMSVITI